jgi:hypothetical protein
MNSKKPEWLQALEAQSWQAELIASGLAIYGSLSMGVYLDGFSEWAVLRFNDRVLSILTYLLIYVYTAHAVLVISFISHLILRILWAGILGLSSVFPKGVNVDSKVYPEHFKEKLKKDYPDLSQYSLDLDKMCSLIFSVLCAMVIVLINISVWIFLYLILSELLIKLLPVSVVNIIGYVVVIIFFVFSILTSIFTQGKFKNSKISKKYGYKLVTVFSKYVYLIGNKSYNYIVQTIRTNVTSKSFFIGMFVILIVSMFVAMPRLMNTIKIYKKENFVNLTPHESYVLKDNYLSKMEKDIILEPIIQNDIIDVNYLHLYIPRYQRENATVKDLCGDFIWNDSISKVENRNLRKDFRSECAQNYYSLTIDNNIVENVEFSYKDLFYNNRSGYEAFIDIDSLSKGNHILTIESKYKAGDLNYIRSIPFYKTK